ncbi:protein CrcB homolog [Clostridium sp. CAG:967]|nr:protein CrcB homolog [Clostridium sp. CAG:967]
MLNLLAVFLGGGLGAATRYLTGFYMTKVLTVNLPAATFSVNVTGSFLIGFLYILFIEKTDLSPALKLALTVGFCGGLTTFSTFSIELFEMIKNAQFIQAFVYALLSVIICLLAVTVGVYCAKII